MNEKYIITWEEIYQRISKLDLSKKYYGIPRGGAIISGMTGNAVMTPEQADIIIDDLIDSGATAKKWKSKYPTKKFIFLFNKQDEDFLHNKWLVFPYESLEDSDDIEIHYIRILEYHNQIVNDENINRLKKQMKGF